MERYGGAGEERSPSDPSLEGSMWPLGLRGGGSESYPERPDEPDCIYYVRTGVCGFGSRCRFNHPRNRAPPVLGGLRAEFPERMGQPVCQHFIRTGTCRFGATCKYHHPRQGGGGGGDSFTPISLNHMGFPLRPGEKECSYYMRTGQCKFGSTCRFHHPIPPGVSQQQHHLSQSGVVIARPQILQGSYVQSPYVYNQMVLPPNMVPYSGWNPYQASSVSAITSAGSVYGGVRPLSPSAPAYQSNKEFPQRLGQPECQYFMRTGDCKFGSSCRFHHPLEAASPKGITLSRIGLPLRPGTAQCSHFAQHGICKFGLACKFDHSMGSSSLTDMPVLSLALSSSSSLDQRTELLSLKPKTTTSGGSETLAAEVSSSSVSHPEAADTNKGDSASVETKTSS